jgi:diadenosine tetraphosphate (Ap4A) HIT family hydrolase
MSLTPRKVASLLGAAALGVIAMSGAGSAAGSTAGASVATPSFSKLSPALRIPSMSDCVICALQSKVEAIPPREQIYVSDHWRVSHAWSSLEGWLVVCPLRHVEALDELSGDELASIGGVLGALSSALRTVVGCEKTYVVLFAEQRGFAHLHFHVVPRMSWLTPEDRGPNVFKFLRVSENEQVPPERRDELAIQIGQLLA